MAQVPIYNQPQVADKHVMANVNINRDMFGPDYSGLANGLKNTSESLNKLYNKYEDELNKSKIVDITNQIDSYTQEKLYNAENGYFTQTGANAMGKAPEIMKDYDNTFDAAHACVEWLVQVAFDQEAQ